MQMLYRVYIHVYDYIAWRQDKGEKPGQRRMESKVKDIYTKLTKCIQHDTNNVRAWIVPATLHT